MHVHAGPWEKRSDGGQVGSFCLKNTSKFGEIGGAIMIIALFNKSETEP